MFSLGTVRAKGRTDTWPGLQAWFPWLFGRRSRGGSRAGLLGMSPPRSFCSSVSHPSFHGLFFPDILSVFSKGPKSVPWVTGLERKLFCRWLTNLEGESCFKGNTVGILCDHHTQSTQTLVKETHSNVVLSVSSSTGQEWKHRHLVCKCQSSRTTCMIQLFPVVLWIKFDPLALKHWPFPLFMRCYTFYHLMT